MQYFGSNIVEGVAESWVETEMSWVELGGAGWSWVEFEMSWVELMGGWVHGLVILVLKHQKIKPKLQITSDMKCLETLRTDFP